MFVADERSSSKGEVHFFIDNFAQSTCGLRTPPQAEFRVFVNACVLLHRYSVFTMALTDVCYGDSVQNARGKFEKSIRSSHHELSPRFDSHCMKYHRTWEGKLATNGSILRKFETVRWIGQTLVGSRPKRRNARAEQFGVQGSCGNLFTSLFSSETNVPRIPGRFGISLSAFEHSSFYRYAS